MACLGKVTLFKFGPTKSKNEHERMERTQVTTLLSSKAKDGSFTLTAEQTPPAVTLFYSYFLPTYTNPNNQSPTPNENGRRSSFACLVIHLTSTRFSNASNIVAFRSHGLSILPHHRNGRVRRDGNVRPESGARASAWFSDWETDHGGRWSALLAWKCRALACVMQIDNDASTI